MLGASFVGEIVSLKVIKKSSDDQFIEIKEIASCVEDLVNLEACFDSIFDREHYFSR